MLYDEETLDDNLKDFLLSNGGFLKKMPPNLPIKVKVHVYIVKISMVNSINLIGKFEPFIHLEFGKTELTEKFKNNSIEPLIGKFFEFEARFPNESQLVISIKNWNILEGTELIGHTSIDLEDRFYSNCYATCGLPSKFELTGYNAWRDCLLPKQILSKLCKKFGLQRPEFNNNKLDIYNSSGMLVFQLPLTNASDVTSLNNKKSDSDISSDSTASDDKETSSKLKINKHEEQLALDALNNWKKITDVSLVPEHVEIRSLYNPEAGPELEQGKIQMWIDIFPVNDYKIETNVKPVDISLRKPKKFQLRIIIFNTKDVILDDTNLITGEKSSDIYVKGFMCDQLNEAQKTDVHYRSLNGEGNFNWRFVFDFEYLPAIKRIVYTQKHKFSFTSIERKLKPIINLHCFDADQLTHDDLLGQIDLNLCNFVKGANSSKACTTRMLKDKQWPRINLFKMRQHRGWWPFISVNSKEEIVLTVKKEIL